MKNVADLEFLKIGETRVLEQATYYKTGQLIAKQLSRFLMDFVDVNWVIHRKIVDSEGRVWVVADIIGRPRAAQNQIKKEGA